MIFSPFLISVSMWGFVAVAFWNVAEETGPADLRRPAAWLSLLLSSFRNLFRQKTLALPVLLLLVPALSFFWSSDEAYWLERTRVRLPFLVLPWAFANLPDLTRRQMQLVLYILVWALVVTCAGVMINLGLHLDEIIEGLGKGRPVPVPRSHIRFSLILATGILAGGWLWAEGYYWRWKWERMALAGGVIFLFACIHVLSVRSGIAGLYAVLLFSCLRFIWLTRRWKAGLILLAFLLLVPVIAMYVVPSFRMRIDYMLWDWLQYKQNIGNHYSDSERLVSLQAGWQIWLANPVLGTGAGDLPSAVQQVVNERYPDYVDAPKLPHNQFIYIMASTGLFGLILSLAAFSAPLMTVQNRRFYLLAAFQVLAFSSFLVEYTIETSIGVTFYLFYTLWFMKMVKTQGLAG